MKNISTALQNHLASGSTTMAQCWKCTRQDGTVFGFTSTDQNILYNGVLYEAATGFTPSAIQNKADLSVLNMDVVGMLDSASITEADLLAGLWDMCEVELFQVNYRDLSMGDMKLAKGTIGEVSAGRTQFTAEVRGLTQQLQQTIGELYSATCRADFGDARCKFDLSTVTVTGTVTSVTNQRAFTDSARSEAASYFKAGKITFTSGENAGRSMEVKDFAVGGAFSLHLNMPYPIGVGDTYSVYPGCLKRFEQDCRDRWFNIVNFRGEPHIPGADQMMQTGGIN